jgi:pimeloyl-ACP methyl ester carboxylesterase
LPALGRHHDVLAPTLPGHAGGPELDEATDETSLVEGVERAMDAAGFEMAHIVGNSLGGYVALQLAGRGRALSVVALAPAGGWAAEDTSYLETLDYFASLRQPLAAAAPHADAIAGSEEGRRRATEYITVNYAHIPADLVAHQIAAAAYCPAADALIEQARSHGYALAAETVSCPVRFVWGREDRILPWPRAAVRYREQFPHADWVELDEVGHCPQLDVPTETAELILGWTRRR